MKRAAATLGLLILAACSEPAPLITRGPVPEPEMAVFVPAANTPTEADIAADARAFLFAEVDKYVADTPAQPGSHLAQMLSQRGREDLINAPTTSSRLPACARRWVDPVRIIREAAKDTQIVIISEANDQPRHRNFIAAVAEALNEDGFTIFASQTLSLTNGEIQDAVLPLLSEGLSSRDPIHGRLMRRVKARDMRIVDFQLSPTETISALELPTEERAEAIRNAQIKNLMERVFINKPDARVIIHVSRAPLSLSAIETGPLIDDENWMEERLRETLGVDALTVSQTDCYAPISQSVAVARLGNGAQGFHKADLMVGHPVEQFVESRPRWRRDTGDRAINVPETLLNNESPIIVEARREGEPAHTVPDDRLLLLPGEQLKLLLPAGAYRIESWTKNGPVAEPVSIRIE